MIVGEIVISGGVLLLADVMLMSSPCSSSPGVLVLYVFAGSWRSSVDRGIIVGSVGTLNSARVHGIAIVVETGVLADVLSAVSNGSDRL